MEDSITHSFKFNAVTLAPLKSVEGWQPEPGKTLVHHKNGKSTVCMLVSLEGNWHSKLFEHMQKVHNLTLTGGEMEDMRAEIYPSVIEEGQAIVEREQLARWLAKIEEANRFRADVEADIGRVAEMIFNLSRISDSPMKIVSKLAMGKMDAKDLGLDIEFLLQVARKFAPQTVVKLESQK